MTQQAARGLPAATGDRLDYWADFVNAHPITRIAEIGVWRGQFAEALFARCPRIEEYYLIDPWRRLPDWNKPLNADDLEDALLETRRRLEPYAGRCRYLRGRTAEMADRLPEIDFAYIDGDHTLRGITVDMLKIWPRIRNGGWLAGDDFSPTMWQHDRRFEPSAVFPFAVHFAEGVGCPITAPGLNQFVIEKSDAGFAFNDLHGRYPSTELLPQIRQYGSRMWARRIARVALRLAGR